MSGFDVTKPGVVILLLDYQPRGPGGTRWPSKAIHFFEDMDSMRAWVTANPPGNHTNCDYLEVGIGGTQRFSFEVHESEAE